MSLPALSEILTIKSGGAERLSYSGALRRPEQTLASFVATRQAEQSLARLGSALIGDRAGAFWLSGPRGAGKTHFLACLTALFASRPAAVPEAFKSELPMLPALCVAIEIADSSRLARTVTEALWEKLKLPPDLSALWRRMGTEVGLRATLEEVGRRGFDRIMIMIDHVGEHGLDAAQWRMINDLAISSRALRSPVFFVVAARGESAAEENRLAVAASGAREVVANTLRGFRSFAPDSDASVRSYYNLYSAANFTRLNFEQFRSIFPFHERTIEVLEAIARDCQRDEVLDEIVKETLCANGAEPPLLSSRRLVMPADLMRSASARLRIRTVCVDQSFETCELAPILLSHMELSPSDARLANDLVKTLFLASFTTEPGRQWLKPSDLVQLAASHLPAIDAKSISELLASMAVALDGIIVIESDGRARYRPAERLDSFLRRWNDGLPLLRLVEPELTEAHNMSTLFDQAGKFYATLRDRRAHLSDQADQLRRLAAIIGASPRALAVMDSFGELLVTTNHEAYMKQAAKVARGAKNLSALGDEISRLQRLAVQAPRLIEIKRYLDAIPGNCEELQEIQSARLQLLIGLDFQALITRPGLTDSLTSRFAEFKSRYCELYRAAHRRRRDEVERFLRKLERQLLRFPALVRLNRVRELGNPLASELEHTLNLLAREPIACENSLESDLDSSPRCQLCEFSFESGPPLDEIDEFEARLTKALCEKLNALARPEVISILSESDSPRRLDGIIEILRRGATDELAADLDEDTAGYIAGLIIKARS